jgi:hypothetical protein
MVAGSCVFLNCDRDALPEFQWQQENLRKCLHVKTAALSAIILYLGDTYKTSQDKTFHNKMSRDKTSQPQNFSVTKRPDTKSPKYKRIQVSKNPSYKTSKTQNIPATKCPNHKMSQLQNVPNTKPLKPKMSQMQKVPSLKMSQAK